jgi:hypothetical protein
MSRTAAKKARTSEPRYTAERDGEPRYTAERDGDQHSHSPRVHENGLNSLQFSSVSTLSYTSVGCPMVSSTPTQLVYFFYDNTTTRDPTACFQLRQKKQERQNQDGVGTSTMYVSNCIRSRYTAERDGAVGAAIVAVLRIIACPTLWPTTSVGASSHPRTVFLPQK